MAIFSECLFTAEKYYAHDDGLVGVQFIRHWRTLDQDVYDDPEIIMVFRSFQPGSAWGTQLNPVKILTLRQGVNFGSWGSESSNHRVTHWNDAELAVLASDQRAALRM